MNYFWENLKFAQIEFTEILLGPIAQSFGKRNQDIVPKLNQSFAWDSYVTKGVMAENQPLFFPLQLQNSYVRCKSVLTIVSLANMTQKFRSS